MKMIVAIGGGSFQKGETSHIDEYVCKRTGKAKPYVLFLPTAMHDDQGYAKRFKQYMRSFGCEVEALRLLHTKLTPAQIQAKILSCDILYIGAGNFTFLMNSLRRMELLSTIKQAYEQGIICVGVSAGANLFFTYGYSDIYDDGSCYDFVEGMDFVHGVFCPHAQDVRRSRFFVDADAYGLVKIPCKDQEAYLTEDGKSSYI